MYWSWFSVPMHLVETHSDLKCIHANCARLYSQNLHACLILLTLEHQCRSWKSLQAFFNFLHFSSQLATTHTSKCKHMQKHVHCFVGVKDWSFQNEFCLFPEYSLLWCWLLVAEATCFYYFMLACLSLIPLTLPVYKHAVAANYRILSGSYPCILTVVQAFVRTSVCWEKILRTLTQ